MKHSFEIPVTFFIDASSAAEAYRRVFDALNRQGIPAWESGDHWLEDGEPVSEVAKIALSVLDEIEGG